MKKGIVALLLLAAIPFFVFAYVSPGKPTGYVNDFAGVLSPSEKTDLESTLTTLNQKTSDQVTVVTVSSLGDESVETYAVKLFEEWGIGQKGKDNGILLLVAPNDKKVRIEVGYGLEGVLTDAQSSVIIRTMLTPAFAQGKYGEGMKTAVDAIGQVLEGDPGAVPMSTEDAGGSVNWFFVAIFLPIWLASILGRSKSWWAGGVLGGIAGVIIGFIYGFVFVGITSVIGLAIAGLIFDYIVSKTYASRIANGMRPPWWIGGGRGGGFGGGGFGGFGGGRSGGGGASGGW